MNKSEQASNFSLDLIRRPRRLRRTPALRAMVREARVSVDNLVLPLIVKDGNGPKDPVGSMPSLFRLSIEDLKRECEEILDLGISAVALFPFMEPETKDAQGSQAVHPDVLISRAVREVKANFPELIVITDIALDPYTSHGHDGILNEEGTEVLNDETVVRLCEMAVLQAEAGVDIVAPSDMMDGRIGAIRKALDGAGFKNTSIMSYAVKFASAYYGPYREAVGSASAAGTALLDKRSYQMDPANRREAMVEAKLDEEEGADFLMVKPAGAYLDIIRDVREATLLPVSAYQVSGEYAQIHAASKLGWLDYKSIRDESLLAIKRAGADIILTYFAKEIAQELKDS